MTRRQDWLLLALAHRKGLPMTPVQIQKTMFLMSAEAKQHVGGGFYKFIPYNYGPFDSDVYSDLDLLELHGLVASAATSRGWKTYAVTPAGLTASGSIEPAADARAVGYLKQVVDWVCSLSFPALLRAIYAKYPKYKANSVFTG